MHIRQIRRSDSELQQPVSEAGLREQLARQLGDEQVGDVEELATGLFNNTFRVTTAQAAYILKVAPKRDAGVFYCERNLMQRERALSRTLQSASPLVPRYLSFFQIDERDAFLQPFVEGAVWQEIIESLTAAENSELWRQLGDFAKQVHSFAGRQFGYPAPEKSFESWAQFIGDNVAGLAEDCRRLGVISDEVLRYQRLLPGFRGILDEVMTPHLLHGDLWPNNVIVAGSGDDIRIAAVIDGERAFWGDPVSDWVLLLYGVPDAFWEGYGENLLAAADPARAAIYRGMYFILNLLEATRSGESVDKPNERLAAVNEELAGMHFKSGNL